jgi:signal transduction histidine kinase
MRLRNYLSDQKVLILLYLFTSLFTGAVVRLGETGGLRDSYGVYVIEVSLLLFIFYLAVDYHIKKRHFDRLAKLVSGDGIDWVNSLPAPLDAGQRVYTELLRRLYREANGKLEEFIGKSSEDIEFITMWVHEIKTPIAASRLIIENSLNHPTEKALYNIEDQIGRIENFVQMALYYERSGDFSRDYMINSVRIGKLLTECIKTEYTNIMGKKLTLRMEELDCEIDTDEKWLLFILKQILDNAVKYSPAGGVISITMEQREKESVLSIRDNGEGIREEDLKRVFDNSFTGSNGRKYTNSTGIGLFLAQKLAGKLGHFITAESDFGHGTNVSVHFPIWNDYYACSRSQPRSACSSDPPCEK